MQIAAPVETTWAAITDHEKMSEWIDRASVSRTVDGAPERNGRGSERVLKLPGGSVTEQVLACAAPATYRYRVTKGSPFTCHQGEIQLRARGDQTELTWSIRFRPRLPGTGRLLAAMLSWLLERVLRSGLKPHVEALAQSDTPRSSDRSRTAKANVAG